VRLACVSGKIKNFSIIFRNVRQERRALLPLFPVRPAPFWAHLESFWVDRKAVGGGWCFVGGIGGLRPKLGDGATAAIGIPKLLKRCQWSYDQTGTSVSIPFLSAAVVAVVAAVALRPDLPFAEIGYSKLIARPNLGFG